ncbi:unnamed protein product, partial [Rotaria magnacalcarata]
MLTPTSTKQRQITYFFQSKKQKTCEAARNHADNSNNSIHLSDDEENVNPAQEYMSPQLTEVSTSTTTMTADNETILKCNLPCCTYDGDGRYVPKNLSHLKSTNDKRKCQLGWFNKYDWFSYCQSDGKVYCYYCRSAYQSGYHLQANKMSNYSFTTRGYCFWKNALAKFEAHEKSQCHTDCGLALRGHIEEESNLKQLLKLKQDDISELSSWVNEGNYLYHDIISEICELISLTVIRELVKE